VVGGKKKWWEGRRSGGKHFIGMGEIIHQYTRKLAGTWETFIGTQGRFHRHTGGNFHWYMKNSLIHGKTFSS